MDDLVTWLRAQLDDDERVAREAANYGDTWRDGSGKTLIYPSDESRHPGPIIIGPYGDLEDVHTDHIVRWDPARVLAEVDAKRRIIDRWADLRREVLDALDRDEDDAAPTATEFAYEQVVQTLALPYADRPGYRDEWRP
jgi:hypothetical protein